MTSEQLDRRSAAEIALEHGDPVAIFGTGGSGTRVLQFLVERAGYFMGAHLNRPGDALDIDTFTRRWLPRYLERTGWVEEMSRGEGRAQYPFPPEMASAFARALEQHLEGIRDSVPGWGWKVPRTILMLPFVHAVFPGIKAIHLVRDGRDMAYSKNDNQVRAYASQLLGPSAENLPKSVRGITFWALVNTAAAHYGDRHMGDRYLRVRYEDVCADPPAAVATLLDFLGGDIPREKLQALAAEQIRPSSSAGRWRERDPAAIAALHEAGGEALRSFGYA